MRYERLALVLGLGLVAACKSTTAPELATSEPSPQAPEERPIAMENAPMKYTKPTDAELQQRLTPLQYRVTQHDATEPPFRNEFWDNHEKGLYVDVVTGQPLFSSSDKFDSGTGWPSFTRPVEEGVVGEKRDVTLGMVRIEVRSVAGDSHLGHVFDDGPAPSHLRYCINSASLRFIPASALAAEGYASYVERVSGGEIAAHTDNACVPAAQGQPGAGCAATLDTITLPALSGAASAELRAAPGVLEVRDTAAGVEVLFDPALTSDKALRELAR